MPENSPPRKVRCTVVGCNGTFSSVKEMVKHKVISPTHDYCSKCDEDFVDEERLLIHKIYSERHIVCPICGVEFKSERGCESHIRQVSLYPRLPSLLTFPESPHRADHRVPRLQVHLQNCQ